MSDINLDRELLAGFLDESLDSLTDAENALVELENEPDNQNLIKVIFRAAHSLKGNSAFFGLMQVKVLAHRMEDVLDAIRQEHLSATGQVIDSLLPGFDLLRRMLENTRDNRPELEDGEQLDELLKKLEQVLASPLQPEELPAELGRLLPSLPVEVQNELKQLLQRCGFSPQPEKPDEQFTDPADPVSELRQLLSDNSLDEESRQHQIDHSFNRIKALPLTETGKLQVEKALDVYQTFAGSPVGLDDTARELILAALGDLQAPAPAAAAPAPASAIKEAEAKSPGKSSAGRSLRIAESSLDGFLDHVGELVRIEEVLRFCLRRQSDNVDHESAGELKQAVEQFCRVSAELRTGIMDIRKVQGRVLLDKAPRIIRDIASSSSKEIDLKCLGSDTRIDKSYAELLDAPLLHIIRNAADHGIEMPEEREAAGKPRCGKIVISLSEEDHEIRLSVRDDGRGLDHQALTDKAVKLGIIKAGRELGQEEIVNLLFMSGVSTAAAVTDISGRGVGMDVVKQSIDKAGGRIQVNSAAGRGSEFDIFLPQNVSTKIIDGYLVKSFSDNIYVLPMKSVIEAFVPGADEVFMIKGRSRMVRRREGVYPLLDINALNPGRTRIDKETTPGTSVLLEVCNQIFALSVKDILGVQKVVVNQIDGLELKHQAFEGAAVLGNGQIALIISEQGLFQLADNNEAANGN